MNEKKLGQELAYPHVELNEYSGKPCNQHFCLTKREYFAGCALSGMNIADFDIAFVDIARYSVKIADALLIELSKEK